MSESRASPCASPRRPSKSSRPHLMVLCRASRAARRPLLPGGGSRGAASFLLLCLCLVFHCTKLRAAPRYELQQRPGGCTSFRGCSRTLCSSAAAPPNLQCGAGLFFMPGQGWQHRRPASTRFARGLSTPSDCSFRCIRLLCLASRKTLEQPSLVTSRVAGYHRLHSLQNHR